MLNFMAGLELGSPGDGKPGLAFKGLDPPLVIDLAVRGLQKSPLRPALTLLELLDLHKEQDLFF